MPVSKSGRLPVTLQAERSECALACLVMVLDYFGHRIDLNTLRNLCPIAQNGVTLTWVVNTAAQLHLAARPLRLEPGDMDKLALPAMLHWDLDHFVILAHVRGKQLVIHDPAVGRQRITRKEAGRHFTGVALEFSPAEGFQPRDDRQRLRLRDLWSSADGLAGALLQLLVLSCLLQVFALALPFYTQLLLDDVLVNRDTDLLLLLAAGFFLLVVFRQLTDWVRAHVVLYLGNNVSFSFATRLCQHLLHLPQEYFSRRHLGDTVSRFSSLNHVRDFLCAGMVEVTIDGMMAAGTLVLMYVYAPVLTGIALAAVVVYSLLRLVSYCSLRQRNEEWLNDRALENTCFIENITAIQGIKLFGREAARLGTWQNRYADTIASGMRVQKLGIHIRFAQGLLVSTENILLLHVGALSVLSGAMSVGMLMAFIGFKDHFYRSVFSLLDKGFDFRLLDVHLERLADIAFTEPEFSGEARVLPVETASRPATIRLQDVAFSYGPGMPLFRHVSLDTVEGGMTVIIGPTGCGKSTLLKILASLVAPTDGELLFNNRPVDKGNLADYRSRIGAVMQNDTLLSGSLLENITFFDMTPDLERVRLAAEQAMIAGEIAAMPMQFQTMTGHMGAGLSGGQVQRLLLARALYKQPELLLLDEATSHLDIQTEARVNASLRQLRIPCVMVAHRPETVLQADRIFCFGPDGLSQLGHDQFRRKISAQNTNDFIKI